MEVKASTSVGPSDTSGLVAFVDTNRESFHRGYIAYCGARTIDLTPGRLTVAVDSRGAPRSTVDTLRP